MPVRFATFNILHGVRLTDGTVDDEGLRASARALDADVVALQEVDRGQPRSGGTDQTALVAEALEAPFWRYVPALDGTPGRGTWQPSRADDGTPGNGPSYGIALLSRLPVRLWRVRRFGAAPMRLPLLVPGSRRLRRVPDEPRVAVAAVLAGPAGPFTVVGTHLSFVPGFNAAQLRAIVAWVRDLPRPLLLLGDLNLPGALPQRVSRLCRLARLPTYPAPRPRVQFDHVLADGVPAGAVQAVGAPAMPISDHRPLTVTVALTEPRPG